jgi:UDP-2,3-diacylglucosamine pyrophosphatase LpxH
MRINLRLSAVFFVLLCLSVFASCKKSDPAVPVINPFSNGGSERNMLVVISDLHLGANLDYAECKNNLPALEKLLKQMQASPNVKELVIAGDLIDEWFVPATIDTYLGKDQADFVQRVAASNKGVFDAINSIIHEGNILVTYVPGNYDLTITAANIESIFPGIHQVRDDVLGLGTYSPADYPKIAIEHSHRYNFFCAPDPFSNQDVAPGTIMPPGYFYTRIAALCVKQGMPSPGDTTPVVSPNISGGESQDLLFRYWKTWFTTVNKYPITNKLYENIIVTNVNGFSGIYSVNDLIPYQFSPGGLLNVNFYNGIQDNWEARQTYCNVAVHAETARAIDSVDSNNETDYQAILQYFMNPDSDKRIVVFGHTHESKIVASQNLDNKQCIYVNSGTWIDRNPGNTTMNFVVIIPQSTDASSQTLVKLYNFEKETVSLMDEDFLRY